jgi:hypothetical protein
LVLVAGSYGGCVHWTPPFLVDLVYHILNPRPIETLCPHWKWILFRKEILHYASNTLSVYIDLI